MSVVYLRYISRSPATKKIILGCDCCDSSHALCHVTDFLVHTLSRSEHSVSAPFPADWIIPPMVLPVTNIFYCHGLAGRCVRDFEFTVQLNNLTISFQLTVGPFTFIPYLPIVRRDLLYSAFIPASVYLTVISTESSSSLQWRMKTPTI
jgi:hypothetical protein